MATPVAHGLMGLGCWSAFAPRETAARWSWLLVSAALATAADLDFVPGILVQEPNRFHQGPSHSLAAAVLAGSVVFAVGRWLLRHPSSWRLGLASGLSYASHLLVDAFCEDRRAPFGQPLLWPFSDRFFLAAWSPLRGVRHGAPGDDFLTVLRDIFSTTNLLTVGLEFAVFLPVLLALLLLGRALRRQ